MFFTPSNLLSHQLNGRKRVSLSVTDIGLLFDSAQVAAAAAAAFPASNIFADWIRITAAAAFVRSLVPSVSVPLDRFIRFLFASIRPGCQ